MRTKEYDGCGGRLFEKWIDLNIRIYAYIICQ